MDWTSFLYFFIYSIIIIIFYFTSPSSSRLSSSSSPTPEIQSRGRGKGVGNDNIIFVREKKNYHISVVRSSIRYRGRTKTILRSDQRLWRISTIALIIVYSLSVRVLWRVRLLQTMILLLLLILCALLNFGFIALHLNV